MTRASETPQLPSCRPNCALQCPATSWSWVLDDSLPSPPAWRLAWVLHGLPDPLPRGEYQDCFAAVEAAYGVEVIVAALRHAVSIPPAHGSGVCTDQLRSLLASYERYTQAVAA